MNNRNKIYATMAFFVALSIALVVFLIYPAISDIKKSSEEIRLSKEKAAFLYKQSQELDNFRYRFAGYEPNLIKIDGLFVNPANPIDFIKFLEKISSDLDVIININIVNGKKDPAENSQFSSFRIHSEGDLKNIMKFSEKLEQGPYLLEIISLSVSKPSEGKEIKNKTSDAVEADFLVKAVNR